MSENEKKPKKKAREMTSEELARRVFPDGVRHEVERGLREKPKKSEEESDIDEEPS